MALRRLSGPDAANLVFEHGPQVPTVGFVGIVEGPGLLDADGRPDAARVRDLLAPRVARLPVQGERRLGQARRPIALKARPRCVKPC